MGKQRGSNVPVILICAGLVLAVVAVYSQLGRNEFIGTYDDDLYILNNPYVNTGLSVRNVYWAFTSAGAYNWHPVTWLSHMVDCEFFGVEPAGHHFANLFYHILNSVLLLVVLRRLTGNLWPAAFIAAVFALHPLNVESVAWASERKNTLSTLFFLLTILAYTNYIKTGRLKQYLPVLLFFGLGLMAKQMIVTLPFVLLLLDFWPLRRIGLLDKTADKSGFFSPGRCIG